MENIIRIGIVTQVYDDRATVRVKFPDADEEVSWEFPVLQRKTFKDKDYWLPDIGEHVVVLMLPYGQEQGFVLGAIYSDVDKPPENTKNKKVVVFGDETRIEYDRKNHRLFLEVKGEIEILTSGNVTLISDGKVFIKGSGTIEIDGGTEASQRPVHDASPCPLFNVCHLLPSKTIKISP